MARYKPGDLSLQQDVHLFSAKFDPDAKGYVVKGINDESDNVPSLLNNARDLKHITAEFKRFEDLAVLFVCEFYVDS